jgi:hypothetical protein
MLHSLLAAMRDLKSRTALAALAVVLLALGLSGCSPYRVRKQAPKHVKASGVNFLDFRRNACGCR